MPRPLTWGIIGAGTIILSKDIHNYNLYVVRILMKQTLLERTSSFWTKKVWEPENKLKSKKEPENSGQKSYMKNQKLKGEDKILESDEKNEEKVLTSNKNFDIK